MCAEFGGLGVGSGDEFRVMLNSAPPPPLYMMTRMKSLYGTLHVQYFTLAEVRLKVCGKNALRMCALN